MKKEVALPAPLFRDPIYDCPQTPRLSGTGKKNSGIFFIRREGPRILPQEFPGYMVRKSASLSARTAENGFTEEPWKAWILKKGTIPSGRRKSCGRKAVTICIYLILPVSPLIGNIPGRCCIIPRTICGTGNFRGE